VLTHVLLDIIISRFSNSVGFT